MAWRLNTALTNFRAAVDARFPNRDRTSDGTIGDAAHQASTSDHNPDPDGTVDAWDMDVNLRSGDDGAAIEMLKRVFQAHPAARYWIHNREIAHRNTGWRRERYTGTNPHDQHVHWNSNQATENSTAPWILEEEDMAVGDDIMALLLDGKVPIGKPQTVDGGKPRASVYRAVFDLHAEVKALRAEVAELRSDLAQLRSDLAQLRSDLAQLRAEVATLQTGGVTAEMHEAVMRRILGSLDGASPPEAGQ